jgi:anaerobic dimethyl sulfoxide reductase subunit B (iron-sulfur subunit)
MSQYGFNFDKEKCIGCQACEVACQIWNDSIQTMKWRNVETSMKGTYPLITSVNVSLACMHCGDAACKKACPRTAISKDEETGRVTVDQQRCVGCMLCLWACPFAAPQLGVKGRMEKCTFCEDRPVGMKRACEEICPTQAIVSGKVEDLIKFSEQGVLPGHERIDHG